MSFSVSRLLRKVNVSEVAKDVKEIAVFINRELLPYLHELRESLKVAFETPSDSLDLIGDTEDEILIRGVDEWETTTLPIEMAQFASTSILFDGDFKRAAVTGDVAIAENANTATITALETSKLADGADFARRSGASNSFTETIEFTGKLRFNGIFSVNLAAQADNLAIGDVNVVRITMTGAQSLTGMAPGGDGHTVLIVNADSADDLTIVHSSGASDAEKLFLCPGGVNFVLQERGCVWAFYDTTVNVWFLAAR
jgi:hypothetical protein